MLTLDDDLDSSVGFYTGKPSSYSSPSIVLTHNPQDPHQDLWCNELHRRKFEVVFVSRSSPDDARSGPLSLHPAFREDWLKFDEKEVDEGREIEVDIVERLVKMHNKWIERGVVEPKTPVPRD